MARMTSSTLEAAQWESFLLNSWEMHHWCFHQTLVALCRKTTLWTSWKTPPARQVPPPLLPSQRTLGLTLQGMRISITWRPRTLTHFLLSIHPHSLCSMLPVSTHLGLLVSSHLLMRNSGSSLAGCGHCKSMKPAYAEAATMMKTDGVRGVSHSPSPQRTFWPIAGLFLCRRLQPLPLWMLLPTQIWLPGLKSRDTQPVSLKQTLPQLRNALLLNAFPVFFFSQIFQVSTLANWICLPYLSCWKVGKHNSSVLFWFPLSP